MFLTYSSVPSSAQWRAWRVHGALAYHLPSTMHRNVRDIASDTHPHNAGCMASIMACSAGGEYQLALVNGLASVPTAMPKG